MGSNKKIIALAIMALLGTWLSAIDVTAESVLGARGEGIGFSFGALADEPFGLLYNPAGPAFVRGWQAQAQYLMPSKNGLPGTAESPYGGLLGVNYYSENFGNIALSAHQFGSFKEQTAITTTSNISLGYSRLINEKFAAGLAFKYIFETNISERSAFDLDLGATWRPGYNISLAAVAENLLRSKLSPDQPPITKHLSRNFRLAAAYLIPLTNHQGAILAGWQMAQAGETETTNNSLFNLGSEWWIGRNNSVTFGVRGGYTFGKSTIVDYEADYSGWNAGLSLNFDLHGRDLRLDYTFRAFPYETDESLSGDNFISLIYGWGGVPDYGSQRQRDDVKSNTYDLSKYNTQQIWRPVEPAPTAVQPMPPATAAAPAVQPLSPAAPTTPAVQPMPPAAPMTPAVQPMPLAMPMAPAVQPLPPAATMTPAVQPMPPAAPMAPEVQPLPPAAPMTPAVQPMPPAAPMAPAVQPMPPAAPMAPEVQPMPPATPVTPAIQLPPPVAPVKPERAVEPAEPVFTHMELELDVSQLNTGRENRIVFYLRPQSLMKLTNWKLYIFGAKLKNWTDQGADSFSLHSIGGKGIPPLNVIWNGRLADGGSLKPGKYFFVVLGADMYGERYMSDWHKFTIE